jgi:2-polyprenyl-6-methoxyphenol hydroxylase-like FAD-dependent oxidoreductase
MVFDNFLVDEMKRCGNIELIEGTAIDKYTLQQDGYLLSDASGSLQIKAKLVIVANGAHSAFTKDVAGIQMEPEHYCAGLRAASERAYRITFPEVTAAGLFLDLPLTEWRSECGRGDPERSG